MCWATFKAGLGVRPAGSHAWARRSGVPVLRPWRPRLLAGTQGNTHPSPNPAPSLGIGGKMHVRWSNVRLDGLMGQVQAWYEGGAQSAEAQNKEGSCGHFPRL